MAPAKIILLIALTVVKNRCTYCMVSALNLLHNYFCGAIATNLLPKKRHFISNFNKEPYYTYRYVAIVCDSC